MARYRKKAVFIDATQWFRNGDHPDDDCAFMPPTDDGELVLSPGKIVQPYRRPTPPGDTKCSQCKHLIREHGWLDPIGGHSYLICPGDFIVTDMQGQTWPLKPDIFNATFDKVKE
jgi:hypothetical protein